jgi:hypothetical protein
MFIIYFILTYLFYIDLLYSFLTDNYVTEATFITFHSLVFANLMMFASFLLKSEKFFFSPLFFYVSTRAKRRV